MEIRNKINQLREEYEDLKEKISDPNIIKQQNLYRDLTVRFKEISDILELDSTLIKIQKEISENTEAIEHETDGDMRNLYEEENVSLNSQQEELYNKIKFLLLPKDVNDKKNAIMEIRAGTGGDEAALFTSDLYRMYSTYIERKGWKLEVMNSNPTGMGGFKEIAFEVTGKDVFGILKYESGVHRVQRVPETESSGRIHTSASSVVVLPEAEEVDVQINDKDLKIDVYKSSGPGGQSVNTTDSAVRITHKPSGLVVTCQDEKSQHKNKKKALKVLRSRLLDQEIQMQQKRRSNKRKSIVGSGDRSAKIRTYNFPQSRITDHRIKYTTHNLEAIINGDIQELIDKLHFEVQREFFEDK